MSVAEQWCLTHAVTTAKFLRVSHRRGSNIGYLRLHLRPDRPRAAMLWGVGASLAGALLFAVAPSDAPHSLLSI
jgi:hypothetical protein